MSSSGTTLAAAAGPTLANLDAGATGKPLPSGNGPRDVAMLLQQSGEANDALMAGDVDRYRALVAISEDFTLMSPFGGSPSKGRTSDAQWEGMRTFFRDGRLEMELVQAYAVDDMVVLAVIEHALAVEVGGLPAQNWDLRVTLVYRREGSQWVLAHRHADPLRPGITVRQAAELAKPK